MKKNYFRNCAVGLCFLIILTSAVAYESGASGGYSNAPGEQSCTSCHAGTLITSGNSNLNNIRLNPHFSKGGYEIDSTYTLELTFKQTNINLFGFEITVLNSSTNLAEGTFSTSNNRVRTTSSYIGGKRREYVVQTATGCSPVGTDSTRWVFKWKAPASNVGKVKFYITMNAANNDGKDVGDIIYAKTFEFACANALPLATAYTADLNTCSNYQVAFSGSATNSPTSYAWKFTGASPSTSGSQYPSVKFTQPGKQLAILTASNSSGAGKPDTLEINVEQSPGASILNGYTGSVCEGDSIQITANNSSSLTHLWNPNGETNKSIFIKDIGAYTVTNTSTINGCKGTSIPFFLSHYPKPSITISTKIISDTVCGKFIDKIKAKGNYLDSFIWYVNGAIYARTKDSSLSVNFNSNVQIYAIGKSAEGCVTSQSNVIKKVVVKEILPHTYAVEKSSSTIELSWKNRLGIDSVQFSSNGFIFSRASSDTMLRLSNLNENTFYNITLRAFQKSPCLYVDTNISIKTNNCSGLTFNTNFSERVCKGEDLKIEINGLYKTTYSLSFEGSSFLKDTIFTILPTKSDSFAYVLVDSLSGTCPPITEKYAYYMDTIPNEIEIPSAVYSCSNQYLFNRGDAFETHQFYKNNVLVYNGLNKFHLFQDLNYGDTMKSVANAKSCKSEAMTIFEENMTHTADFTFDRDRSNYTFRAVDTQASKYNWYINNVNSGQTNPFVTDLNAYAGQLIQLSLITASAIDCRDSFEQSLQMPIFTSLSTFNKSEIKVYPNPTEGLIKIETSSNQLVKFELINNEGRLVKTGDFTSSTQVDLSEFSKGIYVLKLYSGNGIDYKLVIYN